MSSMKANLSRFCTGDVSEFAVLENRTPNVAFGPLRPRISAFPARFAERKEATHVEMRLRF